MRTSTRRPDILMFGFNEYRTAKLGAKFGGPLEPFAGVGYSYDGGMTAVVCSRPAPEARCVTGPAGEQTLVFCVHQGRKVQ